MTNQLRIILLILEITDAVTQGKLLHTIWNFKSTGEKRITKKEVVEPETAIQIPDRTMFV